MTQHITSIRQAMQARDDAILRAQGRVSDYAAFVADELRAAGLPLPATVAGIATCAPGHSLDWPHSARDRLRTPDQLAAYFLSLRSLLLAARATDALADYADETESLNALHGDYT